MFGWWSARTKHPWLYAQRTGLLVPLLGQPFLEVTQPSAFTAKGPLPSVPSGPVRIEPTLRVTFIVFKEPQRAGLHPPVPLCSTRAIYCLGGGVDRNGYSRVTRGCCVDTRQ